MTLDISSGLEKHPHHVVIAGIRRRHQCRLPGVVLLIHVGAAFEQPLYGGAGSRLGRRDKHTRLVLLKRADLFVLRLLQTLEILFRERVPLQ